MFGRRAALSSLEYVESQGAPGAAAERAAEQALGRIRELLQRADALWTQNKKAEAAPLYKELNDKYGKTDVFKKNKQRIRERVNG